MSKLNIRILLLCAILGQSCVNYYKYPKRKTYNFKLSEMERYIQSHIGGLDTQEFREKFGISAIINDTKDTINIACDSLNVKYYTKVSLFLKQEIRFLTSGRAIMYTTKSSIFTITEVRYLKSTCMIQPIAKLAMRENSGID